MSRPRTYLVRLSRTVIQEGFAIVTAKSPSDARRQITPDLQMEHYGQLALTWGKLPWAPAIIGTIEEVKGDSETDDEWINRQW
jgi:hypothetical protein